MKKIISAFLVILITGSMGITSIAATIENVNHDGIVNQCNTLETIDNLCIDYNKFPLFSGYWGENHIQGIAVDKENEYIYYSFTTMLIKCRLNGEFIGSVVGLTGHLGCIAFNEEDNCIYGTLEYKSDSVGTDVRESIGIEITPEDAFYVAIFDTSKITKSDMDATSTGVMKTVYLKDVIDDYHGFGIDINGKTVEHKYGCSGIDGITFGPMPGSNDNKQYLFVAYGIYMDDNRNDNDCQIILCYDPISFKTYGETLNEANMHHSGPVNATEKFFIYTGNTMYGIQNLEYDKKENVFFAAVYKGNKSEFPNYTLYLIDATVKPYTSKPQGLDDEVKMLTLKAFGNEINGIYGYQFKYGTTGLYSYGDGNYLISEENSNIHGQYSNINLYNFNKEIGFYKPHIVLNDSVTGINMKDISMNYKEVKNIEMEMECDGTPTYEVEYTVSNPNVVSVDKNGNVSAIGKGTATITCIITDEFGHVVQDSCNVKVTYTWWQWIISVFQWIFVKCFGESKI